MPYRRVPSRGRLQSWLAVPIALVIVATGAMLIPWAPRVAGVADRPNAIIVGDSITAFHTPALAASFRDQGIPGVVFDAQQARQIGKSVVYEDEYIRSGISVVSELKKSGVDPKLWIIELGTNEVWTSLGATRSAQVAHADALIGQLLEALGPDAQVAWVTVSFRLLPLESDAFNDALRRRTAVDPRMTLVDWHAYSVTHADWFADPVHPNEPGASALGQLYVDTVLKLKDSHPEPPSTYPRAERLGMS